MPCPALLRKLKVELVSLTPNKPLEFPHIQTRPGFFFFFNWELTWVHFRIPYLVHMSGCSTAVPALRASWILPSEKLLVGSTEVSRYTWERRVLAETYSRRKTSKGHLESWFQDGAARAKKRSAHKQILSLDQSLQKDSSSKYCSLCGKNLAPEGAASSPAAVLWSAETHGELWWRRWSLYNQGSVGASFWW